MNGKTRLRALLVVGVLAVAGVIAGLLVTRSSNAGADAKSRVVVKTARNAMLGKKILVTRSGLTLYSLSAERHGRFICTNGACLSLWKPLRAPAGAKPAGVSGLSVVKRPDGTRQVAYHGGPLYRFVEDKKPGQVKGNGFRDVGVWRAVVIGGHSTAPATTSGGSGRYGY